MKPILSVTLITLAAIVSILTWYGLFAEVTLSEQTIPGFSFVYKKQMGNYRQSGHMIDEIYKNLKNEGLSSTKGVGLYYDNPRKVAVENLRSLAGCILAGEEVGTWEPLRKKYLIATLPEIRLPAISFPYKGKLSVVLGTLKVYPRLNAWFEQHPEHQGPVMEIYDLEGKEIQYIVVRPFGIEAVDALWNTEHP
ncbi:GyrI-like domain-containing protein [Desulfoluna sp.]|uniref:GyrI-like domain-containing protein n=1 Tax=Desulfoluna sp. TaxID=2045199 RepID=UPI00262E1B27|nr:GyrI-like domain-containing protein [Desulfoluna sp.]